MDESSPREIKSADSAKRYPLPDFSDIIFVVIIVLTIWLLPNFLLEDGSTGWHLVTGQYILSHGQIPHTDLFSASFADKQWVPYEWLSDLVGATLVRLGGLKLLAVVTAGAIAWLFAELYRQCRQEGCHVFLAMLMIIIGSLTSTIHWLARPHIFTFYGVLIFSRQLELFRQGKLSQTKFLVSLAVTMLVWSNAHPGFLFGLALIIIYWVCQTIVGITAGEEPFKSQSLSKAKTIALSLMITIGTSFINPNAGHMYSYIFKYLGHSYVLANTNEFMPPDFHQLHAICMAILFAIFIFALFLSSSRPSLSALMAVLAFTWLSINGMRNEPLFVIIITPVAAALFAHIDLNNAFGAKVQPAAWLAWLQNKLHETGTNVDEIEQQCNMHLVPALLMIFLIATCFNNGRFFGNTIVAADFDELTKPTTCLAYVVEHHLPEKTGFILDNWGGYIAYKTGRRVFIDDRLDFYGQEYFVDYRDMISLSPRWQSLFEKYKIDWVLFPRQAALIANLEKTGQWQIASQDRASVLLIHKQSPPAAPLSPIPRK